MITIPPPDLLPQKQGMHLFGDVGLPSLSSKHETSKKDKRRKDYTRITFSGEVGSHHKP